MDIKLKHDLEEYSETQLDVLNELSKVLNEDELSIIDDLQVSSDMMEIVGTALADKVITLKQLENFLNLQDEWLYQMCETDEGFEKVVDFIDSNRAKTFTKEDVNKKKESKISER